MHNRLIHAINRRIAESLEYSGTVVDLGCGSAPYRELILATADEYVGVDWDASQHDRSHVDVTADLTKPLPFKDASADTVVSFQVMEHLPETGLFLDEIRRILRPGGRVFITVPFMWHVHEAPHDYYRFTRHGLEYLFDKHGFEQVNVEANTGFWQTFVLKFNYETRRYARGPLWLLFAPLWLLGQWLAPPLDRLLPRPQETASYTVKARVPETAS
ncbi:MAG: class I SAM-dependent methyltransferase [Pseudomonadota bacterium]